MWGHGVKSCGFVVLGTGLSLTLLVLATCDGSGRSAVRSPFVWYVVGFACLQIQKTSGLQCMVDKLAGKYISVFRLTYCAASSCVVRRECHAFHWGDEGFRRRYT